MSTLLIVEDERNIRRFVSVNLVARGYTVIEAESAEDGLVQLYRHKPEALILDIKLPGMSGWNMLRIMEDDPGLPAIPVIVITASAPNDPHDEAAYSHIVEKLVKPLSVSDLISVVKKALS